MVEGNEVCTGVVGTGGVGTGYPAEPAGGSITGCGWEIGGIETGGSIVGIGNELLGGGVCTGVGVTVGVGGEMIGVGAVGVIGLNVEVCGGVCVQDEHVPQLQP